MDAFTEGLNTFGGPSCMIYARECDLWEPQVRSSSHNGRIVDLKDWLLQVTGLDQPTCMLTREMERLWAIESFWLTWFPSIETYPIKVNLCCLVFAFNGWGSSEPKWLYCPQSFHLSILSLCLGCLSACNVVDLVRLPVEANSSNRQFFHCGKNSLLMAPTDQTPWRRS